MTVPRAVLFDMDGTLTEPMLDFPRSKAEMGIGQRPILEALAEVHPTTLEWLTVARNYAKYSNTGGQYDDVAAFLKANGL